MVYTEILKEASVIELNKEASVIELNKEAGIGSWLGKNVFGGKAYRAGAKLFGSHVARPIVGKFGPKSLASRSAINFGKGLRYMSRNPVKSTIGLGIGTRALGGLARSVRRAPVQQGALQQAANWAGRNPMVAGAGLLGGSYIAGRALQ